MRPNPIINITLFCAIIFSLFFAVHQCTQNAELRKESALNLNAAQTGIRYKVLSDGSVSAERPSKIVSEAEYRNGILQNKDSIKQLKERIGKLNKLTNQLKLQLAIKGKAYVPIHDTVFVFEKDTITVGKIRYKDDWLSLEGIILPDSLKLDYKVKADLDIVGTRKGETHIVNVKSHNPNLLITGMDSYQIREKKKFYQTKGFCLAMGFVAGFLISP